jgi:phosphoserine phosphatase RsbU/P
VNVAILDVVNPEDGATSLASVGHYEVLDGLREGAFDSAAALAARVAGAPVGIVVACGQTWCSADPPPEASRLPALRELCAAAGLDVRPGWLSDTATDARTSASPVVRGDTAYRAIAGVPVLSPAGESLGLVAALDVRPREFTDEQLSALTDLASLVADQVQTRHHAQRVVREESGFRKESEKLVAALQASLLPPTAPDVPGMQVATRFVAGEHALAVGGDFFDVFRLGINDWAVVVGDVCGKGARAASLTALSRWTVRSAAAHSFAPSAVLRELNDALLADGDDDDHFCTAVFGRLELDTCGAWLTVATSGHPQPILVRRNGLVERRCAPSLPLGMFPNVAPVDDRVGLGAGDALVLYTDGIVEARNAAGELLGDARLVRELQTCCGVDADGIAGRVLDLARSFSAGELSDDAAVVVIRVPDDAWDDPMARLAAATGVAADRLKLPGYPHGGQPPPGSEDDPLC